MSKKLDILIKSQEELKERGVLTEKGIEYLNGLKRAKELTNPSNIIIGMDVADLEDMSGLAVIQVFERKDGTNSFKILKSESFNKQEEFDAYLKEVEQEYPDANTLKFGGNG